MKKLLVFFLLLLSLVLASCTLDLTAIGVGKEPKEDVCEHVYGEPSVQEATCEEDGKATYTCTLCGEKKEEVIPMLDHHVFDEEDVRTVKKSGVAYLRYTCVFCGAEEDVPENPNACIHEWNAGEITTAATCKDPGVKTFTCSKCSETKTEQIPLLTEHTYDAGTVTKAATCKEAGEKFYTCRICDTTKTEATAKLTTHTWDAGTVGTPATCLTAGSTVYTCTVCGTTKTSPIAATGHMIQSYDVLTPVFAYHTSAEWANISKIDQFNESVQSDSGDGHVKVACAFSGGNGYSGWDESLANLPADAEDIVFTFSVNRVKAGNDGKSTVREMICEAFRLKNDDGQVAAFVGFENATKNGYTDGDIAEWNDDTVLAHLSDYDNKWIDVALHINIATKAVDYYINGAKVLTKVYSALPDTVAGYQACYVIWGMGSSMPKNCDVRFDNYCCYAGKAGEYSLNDIFTANNAAGNTYPTYTFDAEGYTVTKAATCKETGIKSATCSVCGQTLTKVIPKLTTHTLGKFTVLREPTDTVAGAQVATCSVCGASVTESIPALGTGHVWSTEAVLLTQPTAQAAGKYYVYCTDCGARKATGTTKTYADYTSEINTLKSGISSSGLSGTSYTKLSTTPYNAPTKYPTARVAASGGYPSSPRVLMNADSIVALREAFADPATGDVLDSIVKSANDYDSGKLGSTTKHSSSDGYGPKGTHNCDEHILNTVICQSLLYQLTGTEYYGYKAIKIMKEYIATVKIGTDVNDKCRTYGYVMFTAAIVYDWCRDLLTETDKKQIIYGVENNLCRSSKMEVGFPPSGQGAVSGHGSERQILRDYLSFAIAIYDDEPTWYKYIAGRVYEEYVPVRNAYYSAGYTPQGISNYLAIRYTSDLWSAWLLKSATGENPYNEEDMKRVMPSVYANFVNGTTFMFEEGDDEQNSAKQKTLNLALTGMISAYVLGDATGEVWARKADYKYISSPYLFLLKTGLDITPLNGRYDEIPYITYNGGFESRIIAHNRWDSSDAAVFMKIGNRTTGNHDHADAGSFQIYYKALLTGDSGCYDSYGSAHHTGYHQATVAHNSILINGYGQEQPGETSASIWLSGSSHNTGVTTGVDYAYDASGNPLYAYIAGELSGCYKSGAGASRVERRMLTVYDTEISASPMFFFVFDAMKTSSSSYVKTFMLHTPTQPTISGKTVTVINGSGKLVLQNVTNNTIGTKGQYAVGTGTKSTSDDDGMWGRVEITTSGSQESYMLNAMYVTGSSSNPNLTATDISNDVVCATKMGSVVAAFVKSATRRTESFTITSGGSGSINYYVSGVAAGTWKATVGGTTVTAVATEEGGILSFTAPAGTVTLTKQ